MIKLPAYAGSFFVSVPVRKQVLLVIECVRSKYQGENKQCARWHIDGQHAYEQEMDRVASRLDR